MTPSILAKGHNLNIETNLAEYGPESAHIPWITETAAAQAERERGELIKAIKGVAKFLSKQTKAVIGELSPGCRICGQGNWSCLFINGKCNCRCFYCPTVQNELSIPTTNRISFNKATDYAAYVKQFGFKGVSISGGEPLITIDRTLSFIEAVREKTNDGYHIWMYTNGTLLTLEHVHALRDAGLDEIRFDISAADYDLSKVALAAGVIPNVTIEIPAIPEDENRLKMLVFQMKDRGIDYLNLHQLRLTPFNFIHLSKRPYTFLHGEKVTVLESELLALSLMKETIEKGLNTNINYCSFVYKHRFQSAATRGRNAVFIKKAYESVTENGFIRTLSIAGDPENIRKNVEKLKKKGVDKEIFCINGKKDCLTFHPSLWLDLDFHGLSLSVSYSEAFLSPAISYRYAFKEISVSPRKKIVVERRPHMSNMTITEPDLSALKQYITLKEQPTEPSNNTINAEIASFEMIHPGLQDYF